MVSTAWWRDLSASALVAGFVAVLVGYTSSVAIVFQAALALGATSAQTASWMWALGLAMGLSCIALSLHYRQPVLTAWCTPGAALLAATQGVSLPEATGAFVVCAGLIIAVGATGWFERVMDRVPMAVAAALLAGVLTRFGLDAVLSARTAPGLVGVMALAFLAGRRWWPRYAVPGVLLAGVAVAAWQGRVALAPLLGLGAAAWATPVFVMPQFSLGSVVGVALPLFIVTMASQNLPGFAVLRASGYQPPVQPALLVTGVGSTLMAPFGSHAINMAAITASIVTGPDCHPDPKKRWLVAWPYLVLYGLIGLMAASFVHVLGALPKDVITAIAGLALFSPLMGGVTAMMKEPRDIESALVTFLVTASGLTIMGVGSAFWGLVAGLVLFGARHLIQQKRG